MNTINDRIKFLIGEIGITQAVFAEKLNVTQAYISKLVRKNTKTGEPLGEPSVRLIEDICQKFYVRKEWLEDGRGEMFVVKPDEDEIAVYVSELLEDEKNPLNELIIEIMRTYHALDRNSQTVIDNSILNLMENIRKKKGED